ncbi:MAG: cobalamin-dependent protein [Candidatus Omnitrophica bacterium]|nr:cobalamin-dependent protein [Candidatus Omnitrophota bacterium]
MRILLVNPSIRQEKTGHYDPGIERARGSYPSLGLLYIAAVLREKGHDVRVFDMDAEREPKRKLAELIDNFEPPVIGIHVMTWTFHQADEIARFVKKKNPKTVLIAGGAAVTSMPEAFMKYSAFDFGVIGEGEETVVELADAICRNRDMRGIKGIIFRASNDIIKNPSRPFIENLDTVPAPARNLVRLERYYDVFTARSRFATVVTSRGCPYKCVYCDRTNRMGHRWRSFPNARIVEEIKELKDFYKIDEIMFFDDEFVTDPHKTMELCEMISGSGLDVVWECRARVDVVTPGLLKAMKKAGCYRIRYGFESGDDGILGVLKKDITVKQSLACAEMTKDAGIEIFGYFMLGCPSETDKTMEKTLKLALEIDPEFAVFSKVMLIPGSQLFDWAVSKKLVAPDYWDRFFAGNAGNRTPTISTKDLPEERVDAFIRMANKKFYSRPGFIMKKLSKIRGISQLTRQARMGISLLLANK